MDKNIEKVLASKTRRAKRQIFKYGFRVYYKEGDCNYLHESPRLYNTEEEATKALKYFVEKNNIDVLNCSVDPFAV